MSEFLSKKYSLLTPYTPGEQPRDKKYVKLNTNESPYPPCKAVVEAMTVEAVESLRLYCDPTGKKLKEAIGGRYGVNANSVFLSNGSDDILNFSFMAFGEKGAAYPDITYGFYEVFAALHSVPSEIIPLKDDFSIDKADYLGKNKLIVIANPNAPTGLTLPLRDIEEIVAFNPQSVVLIDEAYVDFGAESAVKLTQKYDNLLVVHTFSKSRSMAGARLGYAIGSEGIINDLETVKYSTNPYNVNTLTQILGVKTIENDAYYMENCQKIIRTREFLTAELQKMGFSVLPSKANFIFAKTDKMGGEELYLRLKDEGVLVRHFTLDRIKDFNRITVGSDEEAAILIDKIKQILD